MRIELQLPAFPHSTKVETVHKLSTGLLWQMHLLRLRQLQDSTTHGLALQWLALCCLQGFSLAKLGNAVRFWGVHAL